MLQREKGWSLGVEARSKRHSCQQPARVPMIALTASARKAQKEAEPCSEHSAKPSSRASRREKDHSRRPRPQLTAEASSSRSQFDVPKIFLLRGHLLSFSCWGSRSLLLGVFSSLFIPSMKKQVLSCISMNTILRSAPPSKQALSHFLSVQGLMHHSPWQQPVSLWHKL